MKFTSVIVMLFITLGAFAQSDKMVIGVTAFSSDVTTGYEGAVTEKVVEIFTSAKRFRIVDRTSRDKIKGELENQKSEEFIDSEVMAQQGTSMGAQYLITGHIRDVSATEARLPDGTSNGYKASIDFTIKIVDVGTGEVISSEEFKSKGGSTLGKFAGTNPKEPEKAISKSLKNMDKQMMAFIEKNFPVEMIIGEITAQKGNSATGILLVGGSSVGMKKGMKLMVKEITEKEIAGKTLTRKIDIGELKITKVEDENFSQCTVLKGGDAILAKHTAGAKIICVTESKGK